MIKRTNSNNLIIIEKGRLSNICLDHKLIWELGREVPGMNSDIKLATRTVSKEHGRFRNMDGIWFYVDQLGKNGTFYNDQKITKGMNGRVKPILLEEGDRFIFGAGVRPIINSDTVYALYVCRMFEDGWRVFDTKDMKEISFNDGNQKRTYEEPSRGTALIWEYGMAIYMGDVTYISGNMIVTGK